MRLFHKLLYWIGERLIRTGLWLEEQEFKRTINRNGPVAKRVTLELLSQEQESEEEILRRRKDQEALVERMRLEIGDPPAPCVKGEG